MSYDKILPVDKSSHDPLVEVSYHKMLPVDKSSHDPMVEVSYDQMLHAHTDIGASVNLSDIFLKYDNGSA